jgi:hypothetical protein
MLYVQPSRPHLFCRIDAMNTAALPPAARYLGYAGLLPQGAALLTIAAASPDYRYTALAFAFAYAALIFSFLGALWWGLAAARPEQAPQWVWVAGVMPCLLALASCAPWAVGALWPAPSLLFLAAGIAGSFLVDRRLAGLGLCPGGWVRFRMHLSLGLAALTALCGLL